MGLLRDMYTGFTQITRKVYDSIAHPEISALKEEGIEIVRVGKGITLTRKITDEPFEPLSFPDDFARRVSYIHKDRTD